MPPVNTAKTADYRTLRFGTIDELLAEIDRIVAAQRGGRLRTSGNWTPGQIFNHLAAWINFGYEGFPKQVHPPFFIRWIIKRQKGKYLREGMPRGVRIPRIAEGTLGTDACEFDEGVRRLRGALMRLKNREPVKFHSPAFGPMSDDERIAMQLRHAELHLGYLQY